MTLFGIHFTVWEMAGGLVMAIPFLLVLIEVVPFRQGLVMAFGWQVFILGLAGVITEMKGP